MEQERPGAAPASLAHEARKVGETLERSAEQLEDAAVERVHVLSSRLQSNLDSGRRQAAQRVRRVGEVLHTVCDQVGPEDPTVRDALDYAGSRADRMANYISEASLADMRRDATEFVRRRPGLVFGGALVLGIAAGRLLKAEAPLEARRSEGYRLAEAGGSSTREELGQRTQDPRAEGGWYGSR